MIGGDVVVLGIPFTTSGRNNVEKEADSSNNNINLMPKFLAKSTKKSVAVGSQKEYDCCCNSNNNCSRGAKNSEQG